VIGTRPEAIKMNPVADALLARGIVTRLVVTGQHPSLDVSAFGPGGHRKDCLQFGTNRSRLRHAGR
jgi:hypothetical protein